MIHTDEDRWNVLSRGIKRESSMVILSCQNSFRASETLEEIRDEND